MKLEVYMVGDPPKEFGRKLLSTEIPGISTFDNAVLVIENVKYKSVRYPQFVFVDGELSVVQLAVRPL